MSKRRTRLPNFAISIDVQIFSFLLKSRKIKKKLHVTLQGKIILAYEPYFAMDCV